MVNNDCSIFHWNLLYILCKFHKFIAAISHYFIISKSITPKFNFHTFFAISCILHYPELQVKHLDGAQNTHVYMSTNTHQRSAVTSGSNLQAFDILNAFEQ